MDDSFPDRVRFCCLNPDCRLFGFHHSANLSVCGYIDKAKTIRQFYCNVCKKRFSERKGTVFYNARLPRQKVLSILQHVQEGNGMRQTARLVGTKEDTVIRYVRKAGGHAESLHCHLVAFSPSDPGGAVGREVGLRAQEAEALQRGGTGLGNGRRLLGPRCLRP